MQNLKVDTDLFTTMPKSFGNVDGGMLNGIKLLGKLTNFFKKKMAENKKNRGKKKGTYIKPLSIEQIIEQTIEYLYTLPEYKKAGIKGSNKRTALQQSLEAEIIKYLNPKPTKANSNSNKKIKCCS